MRIFVTGATGFIGRHFIARLRDTAHEVTCLVRAGSRLEHLQAARARLVFGDILDRRAVLAGMQGHDAVVHLAALYSFWERRPRRYYEVNVEGTRCVMECALQAGVSKVVLVSTSLVYGVPSERPFREDAPASRRLLSAYARSKYAGERIAWELHRTAGLPLVVLYPGGVLGSGDVKASGQYVRQLVRREPPARVFEDSVITWVHVRDAAEAILRALERPGTIGERYLLGSERLSWGEFNRLVSETAGVPLPRLVMPDALVLAASLLATAWAYLGGRPPIWQLAWDSIRTIRAGLEFDGSKAERKLGLRYTPIRQALAEILSEIAGEHG
ncbi:MAG: NAD-dependent epimerase/dehydratase family protein [Anaerolineae bacterium]